MKPIPPNEPTINLSNVPPSGPGVTSMFNKNSAELIYVEQMVPSTGDQNHIYWSGCNFFFDDRGGYAGIQHQVNKIIDGVPFVRNNICSIWDKVETDPTLPTEVTLTYAAPGTHSNHFGGEGTGLHTSNPMPWIPNQWYSTVIRRWYVNGESVTRMAMFMYSHFDNKWTHYISVAVPGRDINLTGRGIAGFLERFAGDAIGYYGIYGQNFRMDKNGEWEKPTLYIAAAGGPPQHWNAEIYNETHIKLIAGGIFPNTQQT